LTCSAGVGRTLLSDAFDLDFVFLTNTFKLKSNLKGVGQSLP
jgi:hypothetical protein